MLHHCSIICLAVQVLFIGKLLWWLIKPRLPGKLKIPRTGGKINA